MSERKGDGYYLNKILSDLYFIREHMSGVTITMLDENPLLMDSMAFRLIQIQENAKKLSEEFKNARPSIPWGDIAGLRNHIVHDYGNVDHTVLYLTLTDDVPSLISELEKG